MFRFQTSFFWLRTPIIPIQYWGRVLSETIICIKATPLSFPVLTYSCNYQLWTLWKLVDRSVVVKCSRIDWQFSVLAVLIFQEISLSNEMKLFKNTLLSGFCRPNRRWYYSSMEGFRTAPASRHTSRPNCWFLAPRGHQLRYHSQTAAFRTAQWQGW